MTILGVGRCGVGSTHAGIGTFSEVNSSAARLLLKPDGTQGNAPYINPTTLDYELDDRGIERGNDSTPEKVRLALFTLRNRSAVPDFGLDLQDIQTISANVVRQVEARVEECLRDLVKGGLISVLSTTVDRFEETGLSVVIRWVDLANGQIRLENVSP